MEAVTELPPLWINRPLDASQLLSAWCGAGKPAEPMVAAALLARARAARLVAAPAGSVVERRWQAEAADEAPDGDPAAVAAARALLSDERPGDDPADVVRRGLARVPGGAVERFQHVARLWGPRARPILILAAGRGTNLAPTVRAVVQAAELTPEARVVVVVGPAAWRHLERLPDPHVLAVLQDGLVDALADAARMTGDIDGVDVQRTGNRAGVGDGTRGGPRPSPPAAAGAARTLAEALLQAALAADPRTAGLFAANADAGFAFGGRPAEVDLLCRRLRIAVEVDGYFHFRDAAAYRRDRRKDWLLQRHGLMVLRFLADDVAERLGEVVGRVAEAVAARRERVAKGKRD